MLGWLSAVAIAAPAVVAQQPVRPDVLVADFESADYGDWVVTGEAFGAGPARGTLPHQMPVSGYRGERLVNSFAGGDDSVGTLTSPEFTIERRYLAFLIGGGGYERETCVNLLVDGEVVRTACGTNTEPGGSEALEPWAWDVAEFAGRRARLQVVDARRGGWGHVNLDHVVATDARPELGARPGPRARELLVDRRYLLLPIRTGARQVNVDLRIAGEDVRQFEAELAISAADVSFWSFLDLAAFAGARAELRFGRVHDASVELVRLTDELPEPSDLYDEPLRPQLRFSQRVGWNNDPNGLVYLDGEWHLFFQHNPYGWSWGNMHWGHAVSRDLVHWQQLPIAIYSRGRGDLAFSGGAVVDERNTSGWQTGDQKVIVASWTSTGRGECLAYSNDRGRTFTEFAGNPVVRHAGRDPKIVWYEPGRHWVMVVYGEVDGRRTLEFHTSADLQSWRLASRIDGWYECPELFELPVDGDPGRTRWVVFAGDARYAIGDFDGEAFTPLHTGKHRLHYGDYYASQTFSNAPDGRRVQIGWARIAMPGMRFNQAFTLPHELTLRTTPDGVRMFAEPVVELDSLAREVRAVTAQQLDGERSIELAIGTELLDVRATFELGDAAAVGIDVGGHRVVYDVAARQLDGVPLAPVDGRIGIRAVADRPLVEVVGNGGRIYLTSPRRRDGVPNVVRFFAAGGAARLADGEVRELRSIWR
ncbi:MAG: glycoside hydrolase family 32 protein [Planctomycetes bacterium]|nr:glycoside hydrolase family 32 protein [Planctomycetota bacterium]